MTCGAAVRLLRGQRKGTDPACFQDSHSNVQDVQGRRKPCEDTQSLGTTCRAEREKTIHESTQKFLGCEVLQACGHDTQRQEAELTALPGLGAKSVSAEWEICRCLGGISESVIS